MDPEKMNLTEEDIKNRYISPAIFETAGWKKKDSLMEYYYTDGQINVVDDVAKRSNGKKVDKGDLSWSSGTLYSYRGRCCRRAKGFKSIRGGSLCYGFTVRYGII